MIVEPTGGNVRLLFLGGASEVGASCLVVEAAGRRVLVDAGIRMHGDDPLPDLSRLQDLGGIDAVVVTHAHADHIGALPLAVGAFPLATVIATPATAGLMAVMLEDAIR
ncbi:MAG TPA: MBL fold metallo-hydrolase, partial [Chloroflexota bacterium]